MFRQSFVLCAASVSTTTPTELRESDEEKRRGAEKRHREELRGKHLMLRCFPFDTAEEPGKKRAGEFEKQVRLPGFCLEDGRRCKDKVIAKEIK